MVLCKVVRALLLKIALEQVQVFLEMAKMKDMVSLGLSIRLNVREVPGEKRQCLPKSSILKTGAISTGWAGLLPRAVPKVAI